MERPTVAQYAMTAIKRPNSDLTDDANYIHADDDMNASYKTHKTAR